jgi:hypothetical protein
LIQTFSRLISKQFPAGEQLHNIFVNCTKKQIIAYLPCVPTPFMQQKNLKTKPLLKNQQGFVNKT